MNIAAAGDTAVVVEAVSLEDIADAAVRAEDCAAQMTVGNAADPGEEAETLPAGPQEGYCRAVSLDST